MGKRCFPVEEKGSVFWLCQPVDFQVNVKGMTGNGNIDVFRTNGRSSLAKVSKRDTRVSVHNLERGWRVPFQELLSAPDPGSSRQGRASCPELPS